MHYYTEARELIKTGDILGWTHAGGWFKSFYNFKINLVRLFTRSKYSHVGVAVVLAGRVFILESVTGGVRLVPLSKFLPCDWADRPAWSGDDLERAMSVCGEPYSQLEAMLGALGENDDANGQWQCAELVKWACRLDCLATPAAVMDYALATGSSIREIRL